MAAHALTIFRGMYCKLLAGKPEWSLWEHAMGHAPGIDNLLGFEEPHGASWDTMVKAIAEKDHKTLSIALSKWLGVLEPVMERFANSEEFNAWRWPPIEEVIRDLSKSIG